MKLGGPPRKNTVTVTLRRDGPYTPWGIRIAGGVDLNTPIVITRAQVGSPSEGELKRGDIIRKISDYDARDLRHEDAQNLFRNAGNTISLVIERQGANSPALASAVGPGASATLPRARTQPLPLSQPQQRPLTPLTPLARPVSPATAPRPPVAGGVATPFALASQARPSTPRKDLPISFPPPLPSDRPLDEDINSQPYRTTPLVLPGAKVKKDAAPTESYLRHHPNPMFRAPPSHYDPNIEVLMKQKVVHKQFNSPIGLYSEQNIAETIQSQTQGITPLKKTYVYDPSKSETFKALKESEYGDTIQEVNQPVQPKVFSPTKNVQFKKPVSAPQQTYVNSLGNTADNIQQSGSFRRLMNQVLGESEY